jgi:hypothetical protein
MSLLCLNDKFIFKSHNTNDVSIIIHLIVRDENFLSPYHITKIQKILIILYDHVAT